MSESSRSRELFCTQSVNYELYNTVPVAALHRAVSAVLQCACSVSAAHQQELPFRDCSKYKILVCMIAALVAMLSIVAAAVVNILAAVVVTVVLDDNQKEVTACCLAAMLATE
eukprot:6341-Heterococcus_DN1.PRE.3